MHKNTFLLSVSLITSLALNADPITANTLPTGGEVVAGKAGIVEGGTQLDINQTTDQVIINWDNFNIGSAASVNFDQPGLDSIALNRILGNDSSSIFGSLTADGQVFLLNPNGVLFGEGSQVDTGGLVASTMDLSNEDFLAKDYNFISNGSDAGILNQGVLRSDGGYVGLFGSSVINEGAIHANLGTVALASGEAITMAVEGNQVISIQVDGSSLKTLAAKREIVRDENGRVLMSRSASQSLMDAVVPVESSAATRFVENEDGSISLTASSGTIKADTIAIAASEGVAHVSGILDATNASDTGGKVVVLGDSVHLEGGAHIDVSGSTGGGDILIGGDFQGGNEDLVNATRTHVDGSVEIIADASTKGDGGKVIIWSDNFTTYSGDISARGGPDGGDGGFVEVSGKEFLNFNGMVDASAPQGASGTLLLDPKNIIIETGGGSVLGDNDTFAENPALDATIDPGSITAITDTGTGVTLQANNDIAINNSISSSNPGGDGGDLTFQAGRSITVDSLIDSDNGNVLFTINASGADSGNRDAGNAVFLNNGLITAGTGSVSITVDDTVANNDASITTGSISSTNLTIDHNEAAAISAITLNGVTTQNDLTITADGVVDVVNTTADGTIRVVGTGKITTLGDVSITGSSTDVEDIGVTANNVTLFDKKALQFGTSGFTSTISGNLSLDVIGPIADAGVINVVGNTNITAQNAGFGISPPDISLSSYGHDFNQVTVNQGTSGAFFSINDVDDLQLIATNIEEFATVTTGGTLDIEGDFGLDLTVTSAGAINDSGALIVPDELTMGSGAGFDIVLDNPGNDFNLIDIQSGRNATIVNGVAGATTFYDYSSTAVDITGNLAVTSNGNIQQSYYNYNSGYQNWSRILVDGNASFTVTAANSNLFMGPPDASYVGQNNDIGGTVTIATSGSGSYTEFTCATLMPRLKMSSVSTQRAPWMMLPSSMTMRQISVYPV